VKQGRLNVGVIGTEPAGIAMAQALATAGHIVVAVSTATLEKDDALEVLLPQAKRLTDIQILEAADLVLLAVPAAEITAIV
jgi:predicted dinucleotide-binding enzyme